MLELGLGVELLIVVKTRTWVRAMGRLGMLFPSLKIVHRPLHISVCHEGLDV